MRFQQKLELLWQAFQKAHSLRSLRTGRQIFRLYGMPGVKLAIKNKVAGKELLNGIDMILPGASNTDFGNKVLAEQQEELDAASAAQCLEKLDRQPLISVVMPVYNAPLKWLERAVLSLQAQYYTNWELCTVDDCSPDTAGSELLERLAAQDERIHLYRMEKNGGISRASNRAVDMARGEYVALLDQDDELPPDAFFWMVQAVNEKPAADFLFSDECKIDDSGDGKGFDFLFKPEWSPYLMINNMFAGHLVMYRTSLWKRVGGFDPAFDFGQDYEMAVRAGDAAECVVHVPRILYYWRALSTSTAAGGKSFTNKINMAVPYKWLQGKGIDCTIRKYSHYNYPVLLGGQPMVSLILAPKEQGDALTCLTRLAADTDYRNYEILVVAGKAVLDKVAEEFPYIGNLRLMASDEPDTVVRFNEGAAQASGDVLVFFAADCVPGNREWLAALADAVRLPGIGAASPAVLDAGHCVRYAGSTGYFSNDWNIIGTPYEWQGFYDNDHRYLLSPLVSRDCPTLSRQCIAVGREIFRQCGGFDSERLSAACFHEDFSFRIQEAGKKCYYTSSSQLVCNEDRATAEKLLGRGYLYLLLRWHKYYMTDPTFSPLMRSQLLRADDEWEVKIFVSPAAERMQAVGGKRVLVISHELSRTGAPVVVLDAVREMLSAGYFVVVASYQDGALRQEYEELGVPVLIDRRLAWGRCELPEKSRFEIQWYMDSLVREFDMLFIGTMMGHNLIARYQSIGIPILWWLHEGTYTLDLVRKYLPERLESNVHVFCGGRYVQQMLKKYEVVYPTQSLLYGLSDKALEYKGTSVSAEHDKVRFLIAGTIDERKGQDVIFAAFRKLPAEVMAAAEFIFIGAKSFGDVYDKVMREKDRYPNVKFLKPISREELFQLYNDVDCLICSSRDDPMPVVATEAMMFCKVCLCSTGAGTAMYLEDMVNGLVFENENADMLAEKICYAVTNHQQLRELGIRGRQVYENNFTMENFHTNLRGILRGILK